VIDMEPEAALARGLARKSGEDRFEDLGAAFQVRLREGFLALAAEHPARCRLIDGNRDADAVARDIRAAVAAVLP
jgi:dTMP kinase